MIRKAIINGFIAGFTIGFLFIATLDSFVHKHDTKKSAIVKKDKKKTHKIIRIYGEKPIEVLK